MAQTQEELIREEQKILNNLIHDMDQALMQLDKKLTYEKLQANKARNACLPDAYGMLVSAEHEKMVVRQRTRELYNGKDELYDNRLVFDITDEDGTEQEEIKVGLHTYLNGSRIFITSWVMPVCRHYVLNNSVEDYDGIVIGSHGERYNAHYKLKLKRKVDIFFDKVKNVTHFYPVIDEETEKIISDEFLKELLKRRSGQEFKNIVFSIQKKQGQIIQTPFKQNLIVQGCAGSGKSMIMLHRLPIVLYDNPNSLDRNNLYIITPSITYVQMANNMRMDLEIEDLKMGTLEQYYNHVLKKYKVDANVYGTIKPYIKLNEADLQYVYSSDCVDDIKNAIEENISAGKVDYNIGYEILKLKEQSTSKVAVTPVERIREEVLKIQNVINANDNSLRTYHRNIVDLLVQLEECARMLESRKVAVRRGILRLIAAEEKTIAEKQKEINKINIEEHEVMYQNRVNSIKASNAKIEDLKETQEIVDLDDAYFERLKDLAKKLRQLLSLFSMMKNERIEMSLNEQYQGIGNKDLLCANVEEFLREAECLEDPYWEFSHSMLPECKKLKPLLEKLKSNHSLYVSQEYLDKLINAKNYFADITENIVQKIYLSFMKKFGQVQDEKGRLDALEFSPYLYLQILYLFSGCPNGAPESLITIDEAQNMALEELKLIKAVNGGKVIFNLFGDVKQHVEGSKGIDDWKQIASIANFKKEFMQENYRNARQITEYCNKRFGLKMRAINLDGKGVHECKTRTEFESAYTGIFQKPQNVGLSCIIVKNKAEADTLLKEAENFKARIHNMTGDLVEVQKNKWNLMTAEQAKGLEFETVFAVSGRMSENEKYIAYTRALDELYVYDQEIELIEIPSADTEPKINKEPNGDVARKKRVKRNSKENKADESSIGLKEFFESKGLKVIDDRKKSGHLWVLGSKNEIDFIVTEAIERYGAIGSYGSGKVSGFSEGWFTKSKK